MGCSISYCKKTTEDNDMPKNCEYKNYSDLLDEKELNGPNSKELFPEGNNIFI